MKQYFTGILAVLLALFMLAGVACGQKTTTATEATETAASAQAEGEEAASDGMPNPIVSYQSLDEINAVVGCALVAPADYSITDETYSVIGGTVAEYTFLMDGLRFTVRAARTTDDISGIYVGDGTASDLIPADDPYAIVEANGGLYTRWFLGGMQYSLYAEAGVLDDDMWFMRDMLAYTFPWYAEYTEDTDGSEELTEEELTGSAATALYMDNVIAWNMTWGTSFGTGTAGAYENAGSYMYPDALNVVEVSTVDELLSAIKPDAIILLAPGEYDLTTASTYGTAGEYYGWDEVYDGYELVLHDINGLTILGTSTQDADGTVTLQSILSTEPRYAFVARMRNCQNITMAALTIGHTQAPGECAGGVVAYENCKAMALSSCDLYGCGTVGVEATGCEDIRLLEDTIHDCTYGLMTLTGCKAISADRCGFFVTSGYGGVDMTGCEDIQFTDCDFVFLDFTYLMGATGTKDVKLTNCLLAGNFYSTGIFSWEGTESPFTVEGGAQYGYDMDTYGDITVALG